MILVRFSLAFLKKKLREFLGDISGFLGGFLVNLSTGIARQLSDMYIQNVVGPH